MKKVLITGVNGFCGSHLIDFIIDNKFDVDIHGTIRSNSSLHNIEHNLNNITLYQCDILDKALLALLLKEKEMVGL